jgi:hypothetical protein
MTSLRLSTDRRRLPMFVAGLAFVLAMFGVANLAAAHVVQVTTAIDIANIKSPHDFERAVQDAVEVAANEAIAFEPAVVALTGMRVIGDRVLVGVLFADEAGKQMLEALGQGQGTDEKDAPDDDQMVKPSRIEI